MNYFDEDGKRFSFQRQSWLKQNWSLNPCNNKVVSQINGENIDE